MKRRIAEWIRVSSQFLSQHQVIRGDVTMIKFVMILASSCPGPPGLFTLSWHVDHVSGEDSNRPCAAPLCLETRGLARHCHDPPPPVPTIPFVDYDSHLRNGPIESAAASCSMDLCPAIKLSWAFCPTCPPTTPIGSACSRRHRHAKSYRTRHIVGRPLRSSGASCLLSL